MGCITHGVVLYLKGLAPHIVLLKLLNESVLARQLSSIRPPRLRENQSVTLKSIETIR
jgi:hypothetical protein